MISDSKTIELMTALVRSPDRAAAAGALAAHLGAEEVIALVDDPDAVAFVPAPGFPQTLPGGAAWRALLDACRTPGCHTAQVASRTSGGRTTGAVARSLEGLAFVLVGGSCDRSSFEKVEMLLPFLATTLRAEHRSMIAIGGAQVARAVSAQAAALNVALDAIRSDLVSQARQLEEARAKAEQATRAKDDFMAMLGHELRNPLSPIVTALQILRLKGETSREHDVIERQVAHLTRLVDDLLDVSRISRGKIALRRERIELRLVAARAIEMVSPILEQKRHRLEVDIPATDMVVEADPARLAQVLANLLINAAKYSESERSIEFGARREGDRVVIKVKDQGIGIEPKLLEVIFDRFTQAPQAADRAAGGLGLGLAIVRSLVALHDGKVRAHSDGHNRGSEFVVELPAASAANGASTQPVIVSPPALQGLVDAVRILIVDDNEDAAEMLGDALRHSGYSVFLAHDGPSALRIASEFAPTVGFIDLGLPVMDGFELARRLRTQHGDDLVLVALTGYGQETDREQTEHAGFLAHLVKPADLQAILDILSHVARSRLRA